MIAKDGSLRADPHIGVLEDISSAFQSADRAPYVGFFYEGSDEKACELGAMTDGVFTSFGFSVARDSDTASNGLTCKDFKDVLSVSLVRYLDDCNSRRERAELEERLNRVQGERFVQARNPDPAEQATIETTYEKVWTDLAEEDPLTFEVLRDAGGFLSGAGDLLGGAGGFDPDQTAGSGRAQAFPPTLAGYFRRNPETGRSEWEFVAASQPNPSRETSSEDMRIVGVGDELAGALARGGVVETVERGTPSPQLKLIPAGSARATARLQSDGSIGKVDERRYVAVALEGARVTERNAGADIDLVDALTETIASGPSVLPEGGVGRNPIGPIEFVASETPLTDRFMSEHGLTRETLPENIADALFALSPPQ